MTSLRAIFLSLVLVASLTASTLGSTTAYINVNVIPMDSERVLNDQVVIVEDQILAGIGNASDVKIPAGAEIIDGQGGYLIPGLADMHTHLRMFDHDPRHLLLYLSTGTTTVRTLSGSNTELNWREQVKSGELLGPSIIVGRTIYGQYGDAIGVNGTIQTVRMGVSAAPLVLTGLGMLIGILPKNLSVVLGAVGMSIMSWVIPFPPASPALTSMYDVPGVYVSEAPWQTANEVQRMADSGFDFFKPYDGLTLAELRAGSAKAREFGLYTAGHLPNQISLAEAFDAGIQEVVHVDELLSYHWIGYDAAGENDPELQRFGFPLDVDSIDETVEILRERDIPVVANLSTDEALMRMIFDTDGVLAEEQYATIRPEWIERWRTAGRQVSVFKDQGPYRRDEVQPFLEELIGALHDAGVLITVGTDTNVEGCIPSNIHRELELLVQSGLSNYEALGAGTRVASEVAERMGLGNTFGTIEVGKRADLVLLMNNPLDDISNTRERMGVMAQGVWHTQEELNELVAQYVASF